MLVGGVTRRRWVPAAQEQQANGQKGAGGSAGGGGGGSAAAAGQEQQLQELQAQVQALQARMAAAAAAAAAPAAAPAGGSWELDGLKGRLSRLEALVSVLASKSSDCLHLPGRVSVPPSWPATPRRLCPARPDLLRPIHARTSRALPRRTSNTHALLSPPCSQNVPDQLEVLALRAQQLGAGVASLTEAQQQATDKLAALTRWQAEQQQQQQQQGAGSAAAPPQEGPPAQPSSSSGSMATNLGAASSSCRAGSKLVHATPGGACARFCAAARPR